MLANLKQMWDDTLMLYEDKEKNAELITRINSTIESLLNGLSQISNPKALRYSSYTTTLVQKDKKVDDYFDPYE